MSLPRIEDLDLVFTYAQSADGRSTNLLFTSLTGRMDIFNWRVVEEISKSPLYQRVMGKSSILYPYETGPYPILLATTEIVEQVAYRMESAVPGDAVLVCRKDMDTEIIELHTAYYSCQLPQKLILGCADCVTSTSSAIGCAVRQVAKQSIWEDSFEGLDPEDLVAVLKSRKSKMGDFTYIAPALTAHKHFAKTLRTIEEHDFSFVKERAEVREKIIGSRTLLNAVKKNFCTHCCVKEQCHSEFDSGYHRWHIRRCSGKYPETETELVENIIAANPPEMSYEEMGILLHNSGKLHKRFNRYIAYATFIKNYSHRHPYGTNPQLTFGVVSRRGKTTLAVCASYKEAIVLLEEYNGCVFDSPSPITPKQYALLREAVLHPYSPTSRSRWHKTEYPQLYVSSMRDGIETHYTFASSNQAELPWSLEARNFGVFVQHFNNLSTIGRTPFSDDELKLKRD
jgi:hypothetical protein